MLDLPIFTKKGLYSGHMEEASAAAAAAAPKGKIWKPATEESVVMSPLMLAAQSNALLFVNGF